MGPKTKAGGYYKPKFTKKGEAYYPGMRKDEQGNWYRVKRGKGQKGPKIPGSKIYERITSYNIVEDVKDARANITFEQLVNENKKYQRELREGTYRPRPVNKKD
ncbi:unnamed protein product [Rhizophagus irregularis]|nr:unnamed protein product [Rhizophagus irregularis]